MALNAAGLSLFLRASSVQLQDLLGALNPGDTLKGRVVELLPGNQALVGIRGQNVVAQLPPGAGLSKGDVLQLLVTGTNAGEGTAAASLVLRLLSTQSAVVSSAGSAEAGLSPSPQVSLGAAAAPWEQALVAAKLPATASNLALVQTLSRLGAPLDPQTLNALSQAVDSLIASERAPASATGAAGVSADPVVQTELADGLAQMKIAAALAPSSQQAVFLGQAAHGIQSVLEAGPAPSSGAGTPPAVFSGAVLLHDAIAGVLADPGAETLRVLDSALSSIAQSVNPAPAPVAAMPSEHAVAAPSGIVTTMPVESAVAAPSGIVTTMPVESAVAASLGIAARMPVESAVPAPSGIVATMPSGSAVPAPFTIGATVSGESASGNLGPSATASNPTPAPVVAGMGVDLAWLPSARSVPNSAEIPAMREALAQWLGPMNRSDGLLTTASLAQSAQNLAHSFSDASQSPTRRLIAAVQAQSPLSSPADIQNAGAWALRQASAFYAALPAEQTLPGPQAVQSGLLSLGLPVPKADLSTLPPTTVAEAVAWLSARGLPPQRPLVETVAAWLAQDQGALPSAQKALQSGAALSADVLAMRPSLKQAYDLLGQALGDAGVNPAADGLAGRLQVLASAQGLNLESGWASRFNASFGALQDGVPTPVPSGSHAAAGGGGTLREALMRVENELNNALQGPGQGSTAVSSALNSALKDAQAAVRSFNAVPLQAQGAPAFDTVRLPMPVWMNGVLGDGQLSVTWRQGRARELDDREPVNVTVALDTESLGPVKVHLQVWKSSAGVRVLAQDEATAAFLAQGAEDLRAGFSENTPFEVRSLDFSSGSGAGGNRFQDTEAPRGGLSVRA